MFTAVRDYGYTRLRLYAFTAVRVYGYTRLRLYAFTAVRVDVYTRLRLYAFTAIRVYGYTHLRLYAFAAIRVYDYTRLRLHAFTTIRVYASPVRPPAPAPPGGREAFPKHWKGFGGRLPGPPRVVGSSLIFPYSSRNLPYFPLIPP